MTNSKHILLGGAALAALLVVIQPTGAFADVIFTNSNTGGIGEINVLFNQVDTGSPIFGQIDHSGINVGFSSLTSQILQSSGNGQADIQALPSPGTTLMTSIDMVAAPGTAWGDVIINLDDAGNPCGGGQNTCGTAVITAIDNLGNPFTEVVLDNGQNYVTAQTVPGTNEYITEIQVQELAGENNPNFGWTDFKQPRVSGVCDLVLGTTSCTPVVIDAPEPGALALLGAALALLGLALKRRSLGSLFWCLPQKLLGARRIA